MVEQGGAECATVLVVDDNEANRLLAKGALEDEGYRIVMAVNGMEALQRFETESPDCILLDVRMPGMDGFAVCQELRARGADTPVIFVTAQRDIDTFDRALGVGADDFLTKPVHPAELVVRVQAALKLRRLRAELREHYDLLRHQRDALLRLQLQKERLTSFLVHDLKNPVNSMDLQAQLLLRSKEATDSVKARAQKIREEARYLTRMLLNLLDLSKGEEGRLVPRRSALDLSVLIAEVLSELEPGAHERNVALHCHLDVADAQLDGDLLHRTLVNLVENGIRHAPPGSTVHVEASRIDRGLCLRVRDGGPGVPSEMRARIFDPFVQVDTGDDLFLSRNGRGLGLAFCKLAVEAHGGSIWIEDAEPGAVFCMFFPDVANSSTGDAG